MSRLLKAKYTTLNLLYKIGFTPSVVCFSRKKVQWTPHACRNDIFLLIYDGQFPGRTFQDWGFWNLDVNLSVTMSIILVFHGQYAAIFKANGAT